MTYHEPERNFPFFPTYSRICDFTDKSNRVLQILHMSFEETDTEESGSSLSELNFLNDDLGRMHKLEEKKGSDCDVRRRCVGCYEKNREQQSREACHSKTKRIKTFCCDCHKFFCLDCFNEKHYAM